MHAAQGGLLARGTMDHVVMRVAVCTCPHDSIRLPRSVPWHHDVVSLAAGGGRHHDRITDRWQPADSDAEHADSITGDVRSFAQSTSAQATWNRNFCPADLFQVSALVSAACAAMVP